MAATYTLPLTLVTFSANKVMGCVFNGTGSGVTLKIRRVIFMNNQITGVTGALTNIEMRKISAASGGTTVAATKHDSNSADLSANIILGYNQTITFDGIKMYRRIPWSTDEPAAGTGTLDEYETFSMFTKVWTLGWGDSSLEKLELATGEGIAFVNTGANQGTMDIFIEFTAA